MSRTQISLRKSGYLVPGLLVPGLALLAVILFSGFHFTWIRTVVLAVYLLLLALAAARTESQERKQRQRDQLTCSIEVSDESRVLCLGAAIANDQIKIAEEKEKVLNSLDPNRKLKNQALFAIRALGPPDTRTAEDIRQEIANWENECDKELRKRLLNILVSDFRNSVSIKVRNESEHPAGDVTIELKFSGNCLIWECAHPSHRSESLPVPPEGLHQRLPLGISAKSLKQFGSLGLPDTHRCINENEKRNDSSSVMRKIESLLAHESRTIGPIYVGSLDKVREITVQWTAKSSLRSGVRHGELTLLTTN